MKWSTTIKEMCDEVMKQMLEQIKENEDKINGYKQENEKKMKFEYKFYEKNRCPSWLEGDYDLHIEGNKMTMTSKDGIKVETRCHPDDDWRLQIGLDELKDRMNEKKKPREIKVGDKVRPKTVNKIPPKDCTEFFKFANVNTEDIVAACVLGNDSHYVPDSIFTYQVKYIGRIKNKVTEFDVAYIYNPYTKRAFVVPVSNLILVKN